MLTDDKARQAIRQQTRRNMFVVAGAGSGKTTALVGRIASLVLADGVRLSQIAAVTFTEKAAAELRDRLREELEQATRSAATAEAAEQALIDLDMAPIGTLHSFAARILLLHPIEAGIPPQLTTADEVSSGIAGEEAWRQVQAALLEDEEIRLVFQRSRLLGLDDKHWEPLFRALTNDWDLIESNVLREPDREMMLPDLARLWRALQVLAEARQGFAGSDRLADDYVDEALVLDPGLRSGDELTVLEALGSLSKLPEMYNESGAFKRVGAAPNWKGLPGGIDQAKSAYAEVRDLGVQAKQGAVDVVLRAMTRWLARQVLAAADQRRRNGELLFHDLLVVARQLLRSKPEVAESLSKRYTHLLLDEFQDTDPIQIELAVRIAGGAAGAAHDDWREVLVPAGSLFVVGDPKQSIYRFRRANIGLYLRVQQWFIEQFGPESIIELETNFRSVSGITEWVNQTFGKIIRYQEDQQPEYLALYSAREGLPGERASVSYLGQTAHEFKHRGNAGKLRELEAADVAGVVRRAISERWPVVVQDEAGVQRIRPIRMSDIAVLVPARTSLPMLLAAFDDQGIAARAEASSLLYANEDVGDLLLAVQALADRSDGFALVMTLRSALFGLGDDDLWRWKQAGGSFALDALRHIGEDSELRSLPVYPAMEYLRRLSAEARRLSPAEVLERLIRDRRVLEVAATSREAFDKWRRYRFVVDQARAWSQTAHGGLRGYLAWAKRQMSDTARAYEAVLPETDVDAVRVLTIHAAKGLEFPMVVLSGLTALPAKRREAARLLWTADGYAVSAGSDVQTVNFNAVSPIDEQMGSEERKRLLYVGATRARDHLVVSLHRADNGGQQTPAELLQEVAPVDGVRSFVLDEAELSQWRPARSDASTIESREALAQRLAVARELAARLPSKSASGLEGSDPEVVIAVTAEDDEPGGGRVPIAKDQRDLDAASYRKGRDATAIGTAVHAVLQSVDLTTGAGLDALAESQCLASGIPQHLDLVKSLVTRALAAEVVREAAAHEHWRESFLAMTTESGEIVEGYADLIYRDAAGKLHVVDYKTDTISSDAVLAERQAFYAPQLRAYESMVEVATGGQVDAQPLFVTHHGVRGARAHEDSSRPSGD